MNVFEVLGLFALFFISVVFGNYFAKSVGWLAFAPAAFFGLVVLALLFFALRQMFRDISQSKK